MARELHLIVVGKLKDAHLEAVETDYLKRITNPSLQIHEVKASAENKVDTSKNPLTGNTTVTTTSESDVKVGDATKTKKMKRKQKYNSDGQKINDKTTSDHSETTGH